MGDWEGGEEGGVRWMMWWGGSRGEEGCRRGGDGGEAVEGYGVCHVGLGCIGWGVIVMVVVVVIVVAELGLYRVRWLIS